MSYLVYATLGSRVIISFITLPGESISNNIEVVKMKLCRKGLPGGEDI